MKKQKKQAQKKSNSATTNKTNKLVQAEFIRYFQLGTACLEQDKLDEAQKMYLRAIELNPEVAETYNNLGIVLQKLHKLDSAVQYHNHALSLKPSFAEAHQSLGMVFTTQKKFDLAIAHFQKALALRPNYMEAFNELFYTRLDCCDWTDYAENLEKNKKLIGENTPFRFFHISSSARDQQLCAQIFSRQNYFFPKYSLGEIPKYQHKKIRIAYISADFREHPTSFLIAGLLERHDRQRFEIIAVSLFKNSAKQKLFSFGSKNQDATTQRVKNSVDRFIEAAEMEDDQIAKLLREMEIDIAVDLMGFTRFCRPGIFAYRPAPIQINYLGQPGTMGTEYMDYIFADPYLIPQQYQNCYTEKVACLPDCFQVNDDNRILPPVSSRAEAGLPSSGFVFAVFNTLNKITPVFFEIWMRLLKAVPNSVLWLVTDNEFTQTNLRNEALKHQVQPERLIFAKKLSYSEHLARLQLVDLFLDTFPFNGGATTSDTLWAGVPVVTCSGEAFASRMSGSLLHALGLPELIANDLSDYEALALKLATTPELLAEVKAKLANNRLSYPLFNTDRFRKHIEAAYISMWERYQQGEPPISFAVQAIE